MKLVWLLTAFIGLGSTAFGISDSQLSSQPNTSAELSNESVEAIQEEGPEDERHLIIRSADHVFQQGDLFKAKGNVRFRFKGYEVSAESVDGNIKSQLFFLRGNVLVVGIDQVMTADEASFNFKCKSFRYKNGCAELGPEFLQGEFIDNVYAKGLSGGGNKDEVESEHTSVTTCCDKHPHFEIKSRSVNVRPGKRAVLKDVDIIVLDKRIIRIPYLVVPLERYDQRYIPEFGYTEREGYFVKTMWGFPLRGDSYYNLIFDYYTKIGPGVGGEVHYSLKNNAEGEVDFYHIPHDKSLTVDVLHQQHWGPVAFKGEMGYTKNDRFTGPHRKKFYTKDVLHISQKNASTQLEFRKNYNRNFSLKTEQDVYHFHDQRRWTRRTTTSASLSYDIYSQKTSTSNGIVDRFTEKFLDINLKASQDLKSAAADVDYIRRYPIRTKNDFMRPTSDRDPLITLRTSAGQIFTGKKSCIAQAFPFQTSISAGKFYDLRDAKQLDITRLYYNFNTNKTQRIGRFSLTWSDAFTQTFYSDDTAQHIVDTNNGIKYSLGRDTDIQIRHEYLKGTGFTPLSIDNTGKRNVAYAGLAVRPVKTFRLTGNVAYDFFLKKELAKENRAVRAQKKTAWRPLYVTGEWQPLEELKICFDANYDTTLRHWSNLNSQLDWQILNGRVTLATRHSTVLKDRSRTRLRPLGSQYEFRMTNFDIYAENLVAGKIKASILLNYNMLLKQFQRKQVALTYDLHCTELIGFYAESNTGFRPGREFGLFLRLKALPYRVPFGYGTRGEPVGIDLPY